MIIGRRSPDSQSGPGVLLGNTYRTKNTVGTHSTPPITSSRSGLYPYFMFLKFLPSSAASLNPYFDSSESASSFLVDHQLQTELERVAEQAMVSSRSQVKMPASDAFQPSKSLYSQTSVREKRKKVDNDGAENSAPTVAKRRRGLTKSNGDTALSCKPDRPGAQSIITSVTNDVARATDINESDHELFTESSRPRHSQTPEMATEQAVGDGNQDKAIERAMNKLNHSLSSEDEMADAQGRGKPYVDNALESRKSKIAKGRIKGSDAIAVVDRNGSHRSIRGKASNLSSATATRATHQRFGSEDIEIPVTVPSIGVRTQEEIEENLSEDKGESEDEVPETVTASAAFEEARTLVLGAANVAAR